MWWKVVDCPPVSLWFSSCGSLAAHVGCVGGVVVKKWRFLALNSDPLSLNLWEWTPIPHWNKSPKRFRCVVKFKTNCFKGQCKLQREWRENIPPCMFYSHRYFHTGMKIMGRNPQHCTVRAKGILEWGRKWNWKKRSRDGHFKSFGVSWSWCWASQNNRSWCYLLFRKLVLWESMSRHTAMRRLCYLRPVHSFGQ